MSEKNWSLEETIAKAMCHRSVGDVHAVDVKGRQHWNWYVDDARRFIDAYGYKLQHFGAVFDGKSWSIAAPHSPEPDEQEFSHEERMRCIRQTGLDPVIDDDNGGFF